MDGSDALALLDSSGALHELTKSSKWNSIVDLCDKKSKQDDAEIAWQVSSPYPIGFLKSHPVFNISSS